MLMVLWQCKVKQNRIGQRWKIKLKTASEYLSWDNLRQQKWYSRKTNVSYLYLKYLISMNFSKTTSCYLAFETRNLSITSNYPRFWKLFVRVFQLQFVRWPGMVAGACQWALLQWQHVQPTLSAVKTRTLVSDCRLLVKQVTKLKQSYTHSNW